ncbi:unnamed protein product [Caenorhabditis bovis]|uniref:Uncharacterized protein n=1 Tax=Caenorhabditis bovis TaxID=2654633 RepID=A0A8S1EEN9_9PELO|nr:unnamed protein product [Caenorhabditis bovis]
MQKENSNMVPLREMWTNSPNTRNRAIVLVSAQDADEQLMVNEIHLTVFVMLFVVFCVICFIMYFLDRYNLTGSTFFQSTGHDTRRPDTPIPLQELKAPPVSYHAPPPYTEMPV